MNLEVAVKKIEQTPLIDCSANGTGQLLKSTGSALFNGNNFEKDVSF